MKFIATPADLDATAHALRDAEALYVDTEFESSRGGSELCLLQVSSGREIYLVDAIALRDLTPLADAFRRSPLWVLHAGNQDVALIRERLRLAERPPVFDTQIAWAMVTVEDSVSLAYAQYKELGHRGSKAHQADDWVRRPLPASQLAYAASDVEHLPALHAILARRAADKGRGELVVLASAESVWSQGRASVPLTLDSFRNAWQLDHKGQAALRFLIGWANDLPDERDMVPDAKVLLSLAGRLPRSVDDLQRIKGTPRGWSRTLAQTLVSGVTRAAAEADAAGFVPLEPPPYATKRELRLDGWLANARAELCCALEIGPDLALPQRVLRQLKAHAQEHGAADLGAALAGWRQTLLRQPLADHAARAPLAND